MPDESPHADNLNASDRLSLLIGRVVQADVWLELHLRFLYQALCGPSLASCVVPTSFEAVRQSCTIMVEMAALPQQWQTAAESVLEAAKELHAARNRLAHDMWMFDPSDPDANFDQLMAQRTKANTLRPSVSRQTLSELETTPARFQRVQIRCSVLSMAVSRMLPYAPPGWAATGNEEQELLVVEDRFDLLPDGGFRPHVPG